MFYNKQHTKHKVSCIKSGLRRIRGLFWLAKQGKIKHLKVELNSYVELLIEDISGKSILEYAQESNYAATDFYLLKSIRRDRKFSQNFELVLSNSDTKPLNPLRMKSLRGKVGSTSFKWHLVSK